ncbi:MAG: DNA cytosine methyltransferase [Rhodospirillaceae bacterium]|nr:DNA cytosine methyltransferase [Rhodospirillaceae bacterium]
MKPTLTDLFSGAGLMSAGFKAAGFDPILALDLDPNAVASYNRNVKSVGMVRSVGTPDDAKKTDVLIAGPPCQGFSTLGRQDPTDKRSRLSLGVVNWAKHTKAKVIVIENVPPFLQSSHWRKLTERLSDLDYEIDTWTLNAADYGVPQLRVRSFTIASRIGLPKKPRPVTTRPLTVRTAFAGLSRRRTDALHVNPIMTPLATRRIALVPPNGDKRDIMRAIPKECPPSWFEIGAQATDAWGRMEMNAPANTIRCCFQNPSKGRYIHPTEDRVITLREGARLQGMPDEWQFFGDRYPIARQIGNGVPIPLAQAVARSIKRLFA